VIFSDIGPDIRWVGNEQGFAGDPNWNYLDTAGFKRGAGGPSQDTLNHGNYNGRNWIPAECDVSIRPGWFWHAEENAKVKTPSELFDLYLKSVGRGANLLLNVPPNDRGLISTEDERSLVEFKKLRDQRFAVNLLKDANIYYQFSRNDLGSDELTIRTLDTNATAYSANLRNFIVEMNRSTKMNCIVLREGIQNGQTIRKFRITFFNGNKQVGEVKGSSVGRKRILVFPEMTVTSFKVNLEDAKGQDNIRGISAYYFAAGL
jgi:alpha-L-fucosidase